jgi:hypothetical protein
MMDDYDYDEEEEGYQQSSEPDKYFEDAQTEIRDLYESNKESNAMEGLFKTGYLKEYRIMREGGTSTRYLIHHSNRYPIRQARKIEEIIEEYSKDHITRSCGHRAEDLFCKALAIHGFMPKGLKVKEHNGKKWEKTGHDLDYVFSRDGIEYGCEVKNTLGYID